MSGDESAAEEIIELGIEVINPGGRPEVLESAAKAWRKLQSDVEGLVKDLDREVKRTVGHTWRGEAANAFQAYWEESAAAVLDATKDFDEAAHGLEEAAKCIREVNDEIHEIYMEIGISIGVSVGMSFLTLGVSAAAGTARVTMLVTKALEAAGRMGRALRFLASVFQKLYNMGKWGKLFTEGALNWAGGTAGGMITSELSGKGLEWQTNLIGGATGATVGTAAGKAVTAVGAGDVISGIVSGAAGGVSGDYADSLRKHEDFDIRQEAVTAVAGGASGGLGGAARAADRNLDDMARSIRNDNDFVNSEGPSEQHQTVVDSAFGSAAPIGGGVSANTAKDAFGDVDESAEKARKAAGRGVAGEHESATERIREDFG